MIISNESISLTVMSKNFAEDDVSRDMLKETLIKCKYLNSDGTIAPLGEKEGIVYKHGEDGGQWPVYSKEFQEKLGRNISWMLERFPDLRLSVQNEKKAQKPANNVVVPNNVILTTSPEAYVHLQLPDFVIIDTETTGLNEDDEIIELAVVSKKGETLYHSWFYPEKEIDPGAARINHQSKDKLKGSPKFCIEEWEKIKEAVGSKYIMGHNIPFDKRLIVQTAVKNGVNPGEVNELFANLIDTKDIAKKYIDSPVGYSLDKLTTLVGITRDEQHDATDDCLMTLEFVNRIEDIITIRKDYKFFKD